MQPTTRGSRHHLPSVGTVSPHLPPLPLPSFSEGYLQLLGRNHKILTFLFNVSMFSLSLSVCVCGCAGGQHESCSSHSGVRESDRRFSTAPVSLSFSLSHLPPALRSCGWCCTFLHIRTAPLHNHICTSGPPPFPKTDPPRHLMIYKWKTCVSVTVSGGLKTHTYSTVPEEYIQMIK